MLFVLDALHTNTIKPHAAECKKKACQKKGDICLLHFGKKYVVATHNVYTTTYHPAYGKKLNSVDAAASR